MFGCIQDLNWKGVELSTGVCQAILQIRVRVTASSKLYYRWYRKLASLEVVQCGNTKIAQQPQVWYQIEALSMLNVNKAI